MARLAKGTKTLASAAAAFRQAASFCKGQAMPAKAASEVPVDDLEAELRRLIPAAQARRVCRAAGQVAPAGRPLHFEVAAEAGAGQEGAARRKASQRSMACNACCGKGSTAFARASITNTAIPFSTRVPIRSRSRMRRRFLPGTSESAETWAGRW